MADAWEAIETTTLGSNTTSVTFSSLTTDYQHLMIKASARTTLNTNPGYDYIRIEFNGSTGNWDNLEGHAVTTGSGSIVGDTELNNTSGKARAASCDPIGSNTFGQIEVVIPNYQSTQHYKGFCSIGGTSNSSWGYVQWQGSTWGTSAGSAVTSITVKPGNGGNLVSGSTISLFGLRGS